MLPVTVPASPGDAAHPDDVRRVTPTRAMALLALDEHLFNPSPASWLAIDAGNQRVKGVALPSLEAGLELVGRGRVAALVGHLRDGVGAVDVDLPGEFGHWVAHEVAGWLEQRGCWVLLRPSGGADGRAHVFFAHPDFRYAAADQRTGVAAEVTGFLDGIAAEVKLRSGELDLRDAIRPLSSPHRHGAVTHPKGDLRAALRRLKAVLPSRPESTPLRRRIAATAHTREERQEQLSLDGQAEGAAGNVVPLFPIPRAGRALQPAWRHYLLNGQPPADDPGARAGDRSLTEAALTLELVWAGHNPTSAWQLVREAHPKAMTKARHQGRTWWVKYVWNPAVDDANGFNPSPRQTPVTDPPAEILAAVAAARADLTALMWTQPVRRRPALLLVGHHLLDRVARTGSLRVPCPERDLVLDTGLTDRKTIRGILRLLDGHLGTLHKDCLSLTDRDSTSYEFEINSPSVSEVWEIHPPSSHPPPPPGVWGTLPRTSHSLWRTLQAARTPVDAVELAVEAGLVSERGDVPSKSQRSTATAALVALGRAGLARVDENGCWRAATGPRPLEVEERAAAHHSRLADTVEAERTAYRAGATSNWSAARARAVKAQRTKEKGWWDNLSPAAQTARTAERRVRFDQMSISQQATLKSRLAERRIHQGGDELQHYKAWLRSLDPDEYVTRSLERKARFQSLSPAERGMSVAAWDRHRIRYGLTIQRRLVRGDDHAVLPDTSLERDHAFLERQLTLPVSGRASAAAG